MITSLLTIVMATTAAAEATDVAASEASTPLEILYKVSGDRSLRPIGLSDDGTRTYIRWADSQNLPAVFGMNEQGEEETVDGYMREGVMTIDRVYPRIIFRMAGHKAQAKRLSR